MREILIVLAILIIVWFCCSCSTAQSKTYWKIDKGCEITKLEWDPAPSANNCYCRVTGRNERGQESVIYMPINKGYCE